MESDARHETIDSYANSHRTTQSIDGPPNEEPYFDLDVLDPSRAPLKHLTGILAEFRDEDGSFSGLMDALCDSEKRWRLFECLGKEELILRNPFEAAMGISLLSRLGFFVTGN